MENRDCESIRLQVIDLDVVIGTHEYQIVEVRPFVIGHRIVVPGALRQAARNVTDSRPHRFPTRVRKPLFTTGFPAFGITKGTDIPGHCKQRLDCRVARFAVRHGFQSATRPDWLALAVSQSFARLKVSLPQPMSQTGHEYRTLRVILAIGGIMTERSILKLSLIHI